ncbi:MAG TPA: threonine synthase [Membranihabitans sp.]|nr:threonine synthase [Membranihabitans sp.]
MKLYSTNNNKNLVSMRQAVLQSLPADNGLYMPEYIPRLPEEFIENLENYTFQEIAFKIAQAFLQDDVPADILRAIVDDSINFPADVVTIDHNLSILELFHGPTLAFKDFGARFMARLMNYFWSEEEGKLKILVATSGDTGGAVAAGFHGLDNIEVVILYPKGKVSRLQESQLTTWNDNIYAIEIEDDFDACQKMVKQAFLDKKLNQHLNLSSANSINIARLIPQTFYYFEAFRQFKKGTKLSFCVPSGNFGNLTAGIIAQKMGLPIHHMIAATNINDVVPQYLESGIFNPGRAKPTLSNAMDIGHPSNFSRIMDLYGSTWNNVKKDISGFSFTDEETIQVIKYTHHHHAYVLDPHTAVGVLAAKAYQSEDEHLVVLSTAHPIKFQTELADKIDFSIPYPANIHRFLDKPGRKKRIRSNFDEFKNLLLA